MTKTLLAIVACALAAPVSAQVKTVGQYAETMRICQLTSAAYDALGPQEATNMMHKLLAGSKGANAVEETTGSAMCLAYIAGVAQGRAEATKTRIGHELATEK